MEKSKGSSTLRVWISTLCNILVWAAVLWWYTIELPKWVGFLEKAGLHPSSNLQQALLLHPYAGITAGALVLMFSLMVSRGKKPSTFVNLQFLSAFVAVLLLGWVMWGVYQSAQPAVQNFKLF